ncbi:hypothetical protein HHK36_015959 [Tetracentron sinense]|uniref:Uncharacterized protein n=1 Tax=Tetracentron sinense TaxID=13715 RepID=A0A835DHA8_TETSI|nr:hypothetical protein HHK36_015959 [Tetracentron sinense]
MRRELFLCILKDVEAYDEYFVQRKDCCGRLGCSSVQKMTTATIIHPTIGKKGLFAKKQEVVKKDVERTFGVLQIRPPPYETISPPEYARNLAIFVAHISSRLSRIRNRGTNTTLRFDLMEHLWNKFGDEAV